MAKYRQMQYKVMVEVAMTKHRTYNDLYVRLDSKDAETDLHSLAKQRYRDGKDVQ